MHRPKPIRSCCNGTTAVAGNIAHSGAKTTSASRFQLLAYRELRGSATWADCSSESGGASKFPPATSDWKARRSAAWLSPCTEKNLLLHGTVRVKLQRLLREQFLRPYQQHLACGSFSVTRMVIRTTRMTREKPITFPKRGIVTWTQRAVTFSLSAPTRRLERCLSIASRSLPRTSLN